jgi:C1A family cysteine protease
MRKQQYCWFPDKRDLLYSAVKLRLKLSTKVDLRKDCLQVEQQGSLGSRTANALAGNIEYLDNLPDEYADVSRFFIYYNERKLEFTVDHDSGVSLRDSIKTLKKTGYCWEKSWPCKIDLFD